MNDIIKKELSQIDNPELREYIRPILERVYSAGQSNGTPVMYSSKEVADILDITEIMVNRIAKQMGFGPETKKRFTTEQVKAMKSRKKTRGPVSKIIKDCPKGLNPTRDECLKCQYPECNLH